MNRKIYPFAAALLGLCAVLLLHSCYKYDPIRDKQNRLKNEHKDTTDNSSDKGKSNDAEILSFAFDPEFMAGRTIIDRQQRSILVPVLVRTDVSCLRAHLTLSTNAVLLSPDTTQALDYTLPRRFTVRAENGKEAVYTVRVIPTNPFLPDPGGGGGHTPGTDPDDKNKEIAYLFSFEDWDNNKHPLPVAPEPFGASFWASASNTGYEMAPGKAEPYPVTRYDEGYKGKAVCLMTRPAKKLFGMGTFLVAASLFSGSVDAGAMMSRPLESTLFGSPIKELPLRLSGFYQYQAGEKFIDGDKGPDAVIDGQDQGTIAVIFFEVNSPNEHLNGTNIYTDARILAIGKKTVNNTSGDWKAFEVALEAVNPSGYNAVDFDTHSYKVAIVFSSSAQGDRYRGAIGSRMLIDEVTLTCKGK